jgi:phage terminase large subunit-like protein
MPTSSDKSLAAKYKIPARAVELMRSLPNYDPFALARPIDFIDLDHAEMVIDLFNNHIKVPDGDHAGEQYILPWWQEATMLNFYGWWEPGGFRRFREAIIYVGKKNSKTTWTAGWGAIEFRFLAKHGAQFLSAAATREQAGHVFKAWCNMLHFDDVLREGIEIYGEKGPGTVKSIVRPEIHGAYKPMSRDADSGDGVGPDFLLIDELHRHKDGELMETLEKSTAAKRNALIIKTTTADYDRPSPCNAMVRRARLICQNDGDPNKPGYAPRTLPCLFEVTQQEYKENPDCWQDLEYWKKANPNWGLTVHEEFAIDEIQKAKDDPATLNNLLRLHLNIVTEQSEIWIPMDKWDACQTGRTDEELRNEPCWAGFDLSATQDLTSLALCWKHPDGGYDMRWWFWIPGDKLHDREKKDGVLYSSWQREGFIELIPGEVIDVEIVQDRLLSIFNEFNVQKVCADPWNNSATMQFLINRGFNVGVFRQGPASITEPGKEMMRRIVEKTFRHNGNPIARWNASNAMIKNAPNETFSLDKDKAERRIDGIAAAIMAVGGAMEGVTVKQSAYATGGVVWGSG